MANVTVRTSPPGVWPAETASIDETVYARVEADVLRRKTGELLEGTDRQDAIDMRERATHKRPKIGTPLTDAEAEVDDDDITFSVAFTADPAPEVKWYKTPENGLRTEIIDSATEDITVGSTTSSLVLDNMTLGMNGTVIDVVIRNYKGEVSSSATLSVEEGA